MATLPENLLSMTTDWHLRKINLLWRKTIVIFFWYEGALQIHSLRSIILTRKYAQVDDGGQATFGCEIKLRAAFEKAVCNDDQSGLHSYCDTLWKSCTGWDGGQDVIAEARCEQARAVCLCFEGCLNTLQTVKTSIDNGTPVLVIQGSARASDMIADCLEALD